MDSPGEVVLLGESNLGSKKGRWDQVGSSLELLDYSVGERGNKLISRAVPISIYRTTSVAAALAGVESFDTPEEASLGLRAAAGSKRASRAWSINTPEKKSL